jgi:hypothetical protein
VTDLARLRKSDSVMATFLSSGVLLRVRVIMYPMHVARRCIQTKSERQLMQILAKLGNATNSL